MLAVFKLFWVVGWVVAIIFSHDNYPDITKPIIIKFILLFDIISLSFSSSYLYNHFKSSVVTSLRKTNESEGHSL